MSHALQAIHVVLVNPSNKAHQENEAMSRAIHFGALVVVSCAMSSFALGLVWAIEAPSAETDATTASASEIAQWVQDLDSDTFATRQAASEQLLKAGAAAAEPLANATLEGSLEVTTQALDLLRKLHASEDQTVSAAAEAALKRLAASEKRSIARRAEEILNPPQPPQQIGGFNQGGIQIIGGAGQFRIQVQAAGGNRNIEVDENGKKIKIREDQNGIEINVTEKVDGKEKTETYKAKDAAELKKKHPEAHKLYEKHAQQGGGAIVIRNLQIQGQPVPLPAAPQPAVPLPQRAPRVKPLDKQGAAQKIEDALKLLEQSVEQLRLAGTQLGDGRPQAIHKAVKQLDEVRRRLEEARAKLDEAEE
jgi:hypothetical protein